MNLFNRKKQTNKKKILPSESRFRSSDLWVMSPTRFRCANSLFFIYIYYIYLFIILYIFVYYFTLLQLIKIFIFI